MESVEKAIEGWYALHENDKIFKTPIEIRAEERQPKVIEYLRSLMDSYLRAKELKRTDEEMVYTIRQMEVALTILREISDKRKIVTPEENPSSP